MWPNIHIYVFNVKRKQHSMNTQNSLKVWSRCFHLPQSASAIYWPLNLVSMETPGCLTNPHSWTMAEIISASHKAGKHLCVQKQRQNEDSLRGNWEKRLRQKWRLHWRDSRNGTKKPTDETVFCSTAPINSYIYKLTAICVFCSRVTQEAHITWIHTWGKNGPAPRMMVNTGNEWMNYSS